MRSVVCKLCPWRPLGCPAGQQHGPDYLPAFLSSYKYFLSPGCVWAAAQTAGRGRGAPLHRLCSPKEGEPNVRAHLA